jgi:Gram-negative bacterial TonB protein C-terminal
VAAGGKEFVPPRPTHELQFVLPPGGVPALAHKKQMDLKASIDASGHVTRVELLSPRDEELVTLAAYAANHWSFTPARLDEQPVPGEVILHFHFDSNPAPEEIAGKSTLASGNRGQCLASTAALPGQTESCK